MINFHIITIFPEVFKAYLNESVLKRGVLKKKIKFKFYNPRDFTKDKHKKVDQIPYGGGPGMVMLVAPILSAVEAAKKSAGNSKIKTKKPKIKIVIFSPNGKQFDNKKAIKLQKNYTDIILICGRYEGIDERVRRITKGENFSIGPYILTGGELPAMVFIDVVSRQVEGVLGNIDSIEERRNSSSEVYTRPEIFVYKGKKYSVPKVLLSGHHQNILKWRENKTK